MRVLVTKGPGGKYKVRCDDKRGLTGRVWKLGLLAPEEVESKVADALGEWEARSKELRAAKKKSLT